MTSPEPRLALAVVAPGRRATRAAMLIAPLALVAVVGLAIVGGGRSAASSGPEARLVPVAGFSSSAGDPPSPIRRLGTSGYQSDPYQR